MTTEKKNIKKKKDKPTPCESCAHFDVIDEDGTLGCTIDFDEDEMYSLRTGKSGCPYYKFYNEYKSVQKQN